MQNGAHGNGSRSAGQDTTNPEASRRDHGDILGDLFRAQPATVLNPSQAASVREGSPIPRGILQPLSLASLPPSPPPKPASASSGGDAAFGVPSSVYGALYIAGAPRPAADLRASTSYYTSQVPRAGFPLGTDGPLVEMPLNRQQVAETWQPVPASLNTDAAKATPPPAPRAAAPPVPAPVVPQAAEAARKKTVTMTVAVDQGAGEEENEQLSDHPVLGGYNPNPWDPPLCYGDCISLLVNGYNAVTAYGGSEDGTAWIEMLQRNVGIPPNVRDCQWQLQPARHYVEDKKLKKFLKSADWLRDRRIAVPESPDKRASDDYISELAKNFEEHNGLSGYIDQIIEMYDLLRSSAEERDATQLEQGRVRGKEIRYGMTCVLVHVATDKLLTITKLRALDGISKRVIMDPNGTNCSEFTMSVFT